MSPKNPLNRYEKNWVFLNTDSYIDRAVLSVLDTDKLLLDSGRTVNEVRAMRIILVDQFESVMLGLGKVAKGFELIEGVKRGYPYQNELDAAKIEFDKKEYKGEDSDLRKNTDWANLKFQILLSHLKKDKPTTVEFSG